MHAPYLQQPAFFSFSLVSLVCSLKFSGQFVMFPLEVVPFMPDLTQLLLKLGYSTLIMIVKGIVNRYEIPYM